MLDPILEAQLVSALQALDRKPDIAEFFRQEGIKGARDSKCECPVAAFLKEVIGERFSVGSANVAHFRTSRGHSLEMRAYAPLPRRVREFVERFDDRRYPDLIADRP
jgi:hypothetical protein